AEDGIRDRNVTGVQTCALPISSLSSPPTTVEEGIAEWFLRRKMKQPLPPGYYPDAGDDESNIKTVDSGRRAFADTPWNRDPRTEIGRASCREREKKKAKDTSAT